MKVSDEEAMDRAVQEAKAYRGRTAPNPPVGAVALDESGRILGIGAHVEAGSAHAEVLALESAQKNFPQVRVHTLAVTLEPCNHRGRTGPCTEAILRAGVKRVVIGAKDPNPRVRGGGLEFLRAEGVEVRSDVCLEKTEKLIESFRHWSITGRPWVTLKTAHLPHGSMIPPHGVKTFTSPSSLRFAHELRKRANAILTGSGTVLADRPLFSVRHVEDHPGIRRTVVVLDRRHRTPQAWIDQVLQQPGMEVWIPPEFLSVPEILDHLGGQGCLEVLVEAGPTLSDVFLKEGWVNRHYRILAAQTGSEEDRIEQVDF